MKRLLLGLLLVSTSAYAMETDTDVTKNVTLSKYTCSSGETFTYVTSPHTKDENGATETSTSIPSGPFQYMMAFCSTSQLDSSDLNVTWGEWQKCSGEFTAVAFGGPTFKRTKECLNEFQGIGNLFINDKGSLSAFLKPMNGNESTSRKILDQKLKDLFYKNNSHAIALTCSDEASQYCGKITKILSVDAKEYSCLMDIAYRGYRMHRSAHPFDATDCGALLRGANIFYKPLSAPPVAPTPATENVQGSPATNAETSTAIVPTLVN